jgi:hypothetical protein
MNTLRDYFESFNQRIFPLQIALAVVAILLVHFGINNPLVTH